MYSSFCNMWCSSVDIYTCLYFFSVYSYRLSNKTANFFDCLSWAFVHLFRGTTYPRIFWYSGVWRSPYTSIFVLYMSISDRRVYFWKKSICLVSKWIPRVWCSSYCTPMIISQFKLYFCWYEIIVSTCRYTFWNRVSICSWVYLISLLFECILNFQVVDGYISDIALLSHDSLFL